MNGSNDPTVSFSLEGQTIDALGITLDSLRRVPDQESFWKWAIIGMHAALHGSFGLVLEQTDGAQLLTPDQEEQYRERVDRERASGKPEPLGFTTSKGKSTHEKVDLFLKLFAKVQDANRMDYLAGVPLAPTAEQVKSVESLNWRRGKLIHPGSGRLSFRVTAVLVELEQSLDIVEKLLTHTQYMSGEVSWGPVDTIMDHHKASLARQMIVAIRAELLEARVRYDLPASDNRVWP